MSASLKIKIFQCVQSAVLRHIRLSLKLKNKDVCKALGFNATRVCQREQGFFDADGIDLRCMLYLYEVPEEHFVKVTEKIYKLIVDDVVAERKAKDYLIVYEYVRYKVKALGVDSIMANIDL